MSPRLSTANSPQEVGAMLVLSRKTNESIHIDGGIRVKVIAIQGHTVRLGIEAPRSVGVYREEILLDLRPRAESGYAHQEATSLRQSAGQDAFASYPGSAEGASDVA
jgi:carbon storage regulator